MPNNKGVSRQSNISEYQVQCAFFDYARMRAQTDKNWQMIYATPNEGGGGIHNIIRGRKIKKAGGMKGFPDIGILAARGSYHGMFIELKIPTGKTSPEQCDWLNRLNGQGYFAIEIKTTDFMVVVSAVQKYLDLDKRCRT